MLNIRTNILFDSTMWRELTSLAKIQNTSVGSLVRTAVGTTYFQNNTQKKRADAINRTLAIRPNFKGKINYKALINYGRER